MSARSVIGSAVRGMLLWTTGCLFLLGIVGFSALSFVVWWGWMVLVGWVLLWHLLVWVVGLIVPEHWWRWGQ